MKLTTSLLAKLCVTGVVAVGTGCETFDNLKPAPEAECIEQVEAKHEAKREVIQPIREREFAKPPPGFVPTPPPSVVVTPPPVTVKPPTPPVPQVHQQIKPFECGPCGMG